MDRTYLRFAAACALALAVTTFLLWLLPQLAAPAQTFEQRLALAADPFHMGRLWLSLVHMLIGFAAMLGVYFLVKPLSPGFALLGAAMFFVWMIVELMAMATNLFAVNAAWRAGFGGADAVTQVAYRTLILGWSGVWDGLYFVLGMAYAIGSLTFGLLAIRLRGVARAAGVFLLIGAAIAIAFLVGGYGPAWLEAAAGTVYPVLQPLGRVLLAVWLWRAAAG